MIAQVDVAQSLMLDHPRRTAMGADIAEAAQQVQRVRQQRAQLVFYGKAVLHQHHLGAGRGGLADQRGEFGVAGGLGADQQPVARRHIGNRLVGLHRLQVQIAVQRTVDLQALAGHSGEFAAQ